MALPKQVQRQLDAANAVEAAIAQEMQNAPAVLTDPNQLAAPANDPTSAPQVTPPAPDPVTPPAEDWQQKYKSLQGTYASKLADLTATNRSYESQMANMQKMLDKLTAVQTQEAAAKPTVDPKDIENFGAEMIEMVQRYAEQAYASLDGRLKALESTVAGVNSRTEVTLEQQFYTTLSNLVPDWQEVNVDDRWLAWLGEVDPVYGAPRQTALDAARSALDSQRVANVFKAFKAAHPVKVQESLQNQVAPTSVATPAPAAVPDAKPIIAAKFIERFYRDQAQGKYVGREAEFNRIEAEINEAARDGRIR